MRYHDTMETVFAVTVRMLGKNPSHDPQAKKTGVRDRVTQRASLGWRVTRVEEARWVNGGSQ
jgi:hypothetical protein